MCNLIVLWVFKKKKKSNNIPKQSGLGKHRRKTLKNGKEWEQSLEIKQIDTQTLKQKKFHRHHFILRKDTNPRKEDLNFPSTSLSYSCCTVIIHRYLHLSREFVEKFTVFSASLAPAYDKSVSHTLETENAPFYISKH